MSTDKITRKPYSRKDVKYIKNMIEQGYDNSDIAKKLERTQSSINSKIYRLKLTRRKWNKSNGHVVDENKNDENVDNVKSFSELLSDALANPNTEVDKILSTTEGVSVRHKEMLIEILYKIIV